MPRISSKQRAQILERRKEAGLPRRGDREAGFGKDKPPKGGRNSGGRGGTR